MMTLKKTFVSNLVFSFGTQVVSIVVSLIMTLGIPKILNIQDFGFWQLFIFYSGFIGFFQLGLSDGMYLKYGGKQFELINKVIIKSEILYFLFFQIGMSLIIVIYLLFAELTYPRMYVLLAFSIYSIIGNLITWLGFLLLATNNIKRYSKSVLIEKLIFVILLLLIFLNNNFSLYSIIVIFIISKVFNLVYLMYLYESYSKIKVLSFKKTLRFIKSDISAGSVLMMSNIASTLILGIGRFTIDNKWGIEVFGKVSLALSATYFFLLLLNQISFSLFPMLRMIKLSSQQIILKSGSYLMSNLLMAIFVFYYPTVFFLKLWIPQYQESLDYLMVLMPICLFEGKMQMINTTYFKTLKKQNALFFINISVLALSIILTLISAYFFESIHAILFSMLICLTVRYIISYLFLIKIFNLKRDLQIVVELLMSTVFILSIWYFEPLISLIIYSSFFLLYIVITKKILIKEFRNLTKLKI
ncbi:hypothetical protein ACFSX9_00720 [Flavobacterium ardleyense]|uniref:Polysaccharide biosynthesis protein n=1 Tax=Flavobacterium ardleyense TaxID=2038737 RepID=A0ABW5Z4J3_9FLAO